MLLAVLIVVAAMQEGREVTASTTTSIKLNTESSSWGAPGWGKPPSYHSFSMINSALSTRWEKVGDLKSKFTSLKKT